MHPFCVRVKAEAEAGKSFLQVSESEPVAVSRDSIDLGGRLTISLEQSREWNCDLDPSSGGETSLEALDTIDALLDQALIDSIFLRAVTGDGHVAPGTGRASAVNGTPAGGAGARSADGADPRDDGVTGSLQAALAARIGCAVDLMESAWRLRCVEPVLRGVKQLVGLGIGLTPSGDDFLIGFIGAAYFFANGDDFRKSVFEGMRPLVHRTNLPSFFMLKAALKGCYPEPLSDFLYAIEAGSSARVRVAAKRLTGLGATSGQDMMAGVLSWLHVSSTCGAADAAHYA
jgi:hypothetical protein